MGYQLIWTVPALEDLEEAKLSINRTSRASLRFARSLSAAMRRLRRFPYSGRIVATWPRSGYRQVIVHNYRVIYRVEARTIIVDAVVSTSAQLHAGYMRGLAPPS